MAKKLPRNGTGSMTKFLRCTAAVCQPRGYAAIKDLYNVDISAELASRVTDEVKGMAEEWRNRPPEPFYPVIFFDALRVNIRDGGHVGKKAVYAATELPSAGGTAKNCWECG